MAHAWPVLQLDDPLTEEAKLALLDLDTLAIRGQTLKWNVEMKTWEPIDASEVR